MPVRHFDTKEYFSLHYITFKANKMPKHFAHFTNTITVWKLWKLRKE